MSKGNHIDIFTRNSSQRPELVEIHWSSAFRQKKTRIMMDFCRRQSCKGRVQEKELQKADKSGEEWVGGIGGRREERGDKSCIPVSCRPKENQQDVQSAMTGTNSAAKLSPKHEHTQLHPSNILQRCQKHTLEKDIILKKKWNVHIQNNEIRPLPITLQNKKTKQNLTPNGSKT